jgi:hypothetical protein
MAATSSVSPVALAMLTRAVDRHRIAYALQERSLIIELCAEAVAYGQEGPLTQAGERARSAASLLLELTCPGLDVAALVGLSLTCEYVAASV